MNLARTCLLAGTLLAVTSGTHAQANAQGNAASGASVQADKSSAQASANMNASSSSSAQAGQAAVALSSDTTLNATLSQPVDAKKNKPGDQLTAKVTEAVRSDGKIVIPKGSKLMGHVTECKARSKEEKQSALGIVFDRAILKSGQEIPLHVSIQALAAAQSAAANSLNGDDLSAGGAVMGSARSSGGGALGGVRSTAGAATGAVTNTAASATGVAGGPVNSTVNTTGAARGAVGGLNAAGQLTSNSQGVFGLEGLNLNAEVSSSTQASLITSTSRNVRLDTGTQLVLAAHASTHVSKQ
jgi:hypothetical protein